MGHGGDGGTAVQTGDAMLNLDWIDIAARLGGAVLAGAILGINRDLHHKPAGLRIRWSAWAARSSSS